MIRSGRWTAWALPALCLVAPMTAIGIEAFREGRSIETLLDPAIHGLLVNTLALAALATLFAVVVGFPLGFAIGAYAFPLRSFVVAAAFVPLLVPHHIHTIGWMRWIGRQGWITTRLAEDGIALDVRAAWIPYVWPGPAWILAMALFPLVALPVADALRRIDRESAAAARIAGGTRAALTAVYMPAAKAVLPGAAALVFALAAGAYAVPSLLDTPVLVQRLFFTFSQRSQGEGALLALPLFVSAAVAASLLGDPSWRRGTLGGAARAVRLPGGPWMTCAALVPVLLGVGVPMAGLIGKLVEESRRTGEGLAAFQLVWARTAASFGNGLLFATLAGLVLLVAAWPLARRFAARPGGASERGLTALIAMPPVLLGVGTILFWKETDGVPVIGGLYRDGLILVVLALAGRFLPIVVRVLRDGFLGLDPSAEEAARLAGASSAKRFRMISLPMMASTLGVAWTAAMTLALVELDTTLLTYPPGMETVQVRIFNMVHYARDAEVSALCLLATALGLLPVVIHALITSGEEERHGHGA